jgi:hypothetical protein
LKKKLLGLLPGARLLVLGGKVKRKRKRKRKEKGAFYGRYHTMLHEMDEEMPPGFSKYGKDFFMRACMITTNPYIVMPLFKNKYA